MDKLCQDEYKQPKQYSVSGQCSPSQTCSIIAVPLQVAFEELVEYTSLASWTNGCWPMPSQCTRHRGRNTE